MDVGLAMPDIASMSVALSHSKALSEVGTAILAKTLDTVEAEGGNMVKMMEQSVNPGLGMNIDARV